MRTYKLTIAYDGSRYQGWQRQSNTDKTIQGLLEQAASETAGYPLEVQGSGRTDGGVHAKGQTASAVSYTHLDVYKRQVLQVRLPQSEAGSRWGSCLAF